ncbi:dual serine/threonine and tyrosine protein kinase-like [Glandiceps talaboti]
MADSVDNALSSFSEKVDIIRELVNSTKQLEAQIQQLLDTKTPIQLLKDSERELIETKLHHTAVIGVIGERNCGKSSLINELLGHKVVPQASMTCTSRVVQVKYSDKPYICLLKTDGTEEEGTQASLSGVRGSEKKDLDLLKGLVVLKGDDREKEDLVSQVVVVGLDHPMLQHGAEIIDSPGRNENKILDGVVDNFITKKCIPVLIYVIDGNMFLRPSDRASIQYFKDRCQNTQLLYVCSKVDIDQQAKGMDEPSDDEDDTDGGEDRKPPVDKGARVLDQLREYRLLDDQGSRGTYHAISVKEVKKARVSRASSYDDNHFIKDFQTFQHNLGVCLNNYLNDSVMAAVETLAKCHANCLYVFNMKQGDIGKEEEEMTNALQDARALENKLISELTKVVDSKRERVMAIINNAIQDAVGKVTGDAIVPQEVIAYTHYLWTPAVKQKYGSKLSTSKQFYKLHALCHEVRNYIINTMMLRVEEDVDDLLENEVAGNAWPIVVETLDALDNPTLKRNLESMYQVTGSKSDHRKLTYKSLTRLVYSMLAAAKEAVSAELQQTYDVLSVVEIAFQTYKKMSKKTQQWQNEIATKLVSRMNVQRLTSNIVNACSDKMRENHGMFEASLLEIDALKEQLQEQKREHLGAVQSRVISQLAILDVKNRAINYEITRGLVTIGDQLHHGNHGRIHQLTHLDGRWELQRLDQYVVCVADENDKCWEKNLSSLHYASICKRSEHLLEILGWVMPKPGALYIVTEKWCDTLDMAEMTSGQQLQVTLDVVRGIRDIHASGFIYSNLEAENVLIMPDGRAKINTCRGNFEVLRQKAANVDIHQIGALLLWFHGAETNQSTPESTFRIGRPSDCGVQVWRLIERCMAKHKTITVDDIIRELETIVGG